jgi:hypothetical protein
MSSDYLGERIHISRLSESQHWQNMTGSTLSALHFTAWKVTSTTDCTRGRSARICSRRPGGEKDLLPMPGIQPRFNGCKSLSLDTIPTAVSRLLQQNKTTKEVIFRRDTKDKLLKTKAAVWYNKVTAKQMLLSLFT